MASADLAVAGLAFPDGLSESHRDLWRQFVETRKAATGRTWGREAAETNLKKLAQLEREAGEQAVRENLEQAIAGEYRQVPANIRGKRNDEHQSGHHIKDPAELDGITSW